MKIRQVSNEVAVAGQLNKQDLAQVASLGFRSVINNRPDGEADDQPDSAALAIEAERLGLAYREQPVESGGVTVEDALEFGRALESLQGPVLAFCRSGTRSITLWALNQARSSGIEAALRTAYEAGYDLSGLRPLFRMLATTAAPDAHAAGPQAVSRAVQLR